MNGAGVCGACVDVVLLCVSGAYVCVCVLVCVVRVRCPCVLRGWVVCFAACVWHERMVRSCAFTRLCACVFLSARVSACFSWCVC